MSASQDRAAETVGFSTTDGASALVETGCEFSFAGITGTFVAGGSVGALARILSAVGRFRILTPPLTVLIFTVAPPWPRLPFKFLLTRNSFFTLSEGNSLVMLPLSVLTENFASASSGNASSIAPLTALSDTDSPPPSALMSAVMPPFTVVSFKLGTAFETHHRERRHH